MGGATWLESILSLAAAETVAAGYAEITPGHLLIALSKATENSSGLGPPIGDSARHEFEQLGIEPRRFRQRLREVFGRCGVQPGNVIHRSPACKALIARAERMAADQGVPFDAGLLARVVFLSLSQDVSNEATDRVVMPRPEDIPTEL